MTPTVFLLALAGSVAVLIAVGFHNRSLRMKNAALRRHVDCVNHAMATASHELKTPLTLLAGPVRDLRDGLFGEVPPHVQKALVRADRQVLRLERLIGQLYDASCLDAGALSRAVKPTDMVGIASAVVDDFSRSAEANGIRLRFVPGEDQILGLADREGMERVLVNVVSNAIKHTSAGGTVTVWVGQSGAEVHADVFDTGTGVPFEHQERIFTRFFKASDEESAPKQGMGIGLHLSRGLMTSMGGTISLLSSSPKGSCFRVSVPACRVTTSPADRLVDQLRKDLGLPDYLASDGA